MDNELHQKLIAPFPKSAVSWRAQSLTKANDKALALAYIDARDVMRRLDDVVGFENWQDEYVETAAKRVVCKLSIRINGEWISKSDGAGDTAVEAEKGGLSDAFKRAAVKWGIGRYLYDMEAVYVPCETYKNSAGKIVFSKFTKSPWEFVKKAPAQPESVVNSNPDILVEPVEPTENEKLKTPDEKSLHIKLKVPSKTNGFYDKGFAEWIDALRYLYSVVNKTTEHAKKLVILEKNKKIIVDTLGDMKLRNYTARILTLVNLTPDDFAIDETLEIPADSK